MMSLLYVQRMGWQRTASETLGFSHHRDEQYTSMVAQQVYFLPYGHYIRLHPPGKDRVVRRS
jgi:hypothetical protein